LNKFQYYRQIRFGRAAFAPRRIENSENIARVGLPVVAISRQKFKEVAKNICQFGFLVE